ncbi:hypothetical protein E6H23_01055 [Candidatus Bathyarchaeota archaeon]|nr:MAG: hypothetical protein E6H23_01055 [Candidatus Bathyarchaeota archaeon]
MVSVSDELDDALESIAIVHRLNKSKALEMLMREHPIIRKEIEIMSAEPKKGVLVVDPKSLPKPKKAP